MSLGLPATNCGHVRPRPFVFSTWSYGPMIRKCTLALTVVMIAFGSMFAEEIKGALVSFKEGKDKDPGILTIKVKDKDDKETEKEFKIPADLKMKRKGKDGTETEVL